MKLIRFIILAIFLSICGLATAQEAQLAPASPQAPPAPPVAMTDRAPMALEAPPAPPMAMTVQIPPTPETPMAYAFNMAGGSYLGVATANVTSENASRLGLGEPRGVVIEQVMEDTPASRAGLLKGDVILKFEGEEVTSVQKLTRLINEVAPDQKAKLRISRGGREQDITVTVGKRKDSFSWNGRIEDIGKLNSELGAINGQDLGKLREQMGKLRVEGLASGQNGVWAFGGGRRVGISTIGLTKQLADYFGVSGGKGVLITSVNPDSPAAKSGLKAGDVITEVDSAAIDDTGDVSRAINQKNEGDVTFTVIRDRGQRMFTVTPEKGATGFNFPEGGLIHPSVMVQPRVRVEGVTPGVAPRVVVPGIRIRSGSVIL
ncbi:MAG: PDZ domain-containing protein [Pyrinomonadaceae bacterium]